MLAALHVDDPLPIHAHTPGSREEVTSLTTLYRLHHKKLILKLTIIVWWLWSLLWEQETGETFLSIPIPSELEVHNGPTLVLSHPDGSKLVQLGEAVGEMGQLVTCDVEDGELCESGEVCWQLYEMVVAQGEDGETGAQPDL